MLAIAGGKGGAGKTTTALGLGDALGGTPLVVDADVEMPNLHALARVDREPTLADVDGDPVATAQAPSGHDCLVLPAPGREDPPVDRLLERFAGALDRSAGLLVDCPAGAAPDAVAPLRVADGVVLVTPLCAAALRDTAKTAAMARTLGTPVVGAVVTRTDLNPPSVATLFDCPLLASVPAVNRGDPLADAGVRSAYETAGIQLEEAISRVTGV